ncbi:hypothetical protein ACJX0J_010039, partial [Zea mays]
VPLTDNNNAIIGGKLQTCFRAKKLLIKKIQSLNFDIRACNLFIYIFSLKKITFCGLAQNHVLPNNEIHTAFESSRPGVFFVYKYRRSSQVKA